MSRFDAANVLGIKDGPRGHYPVFEVWIDTDGGELGYRATPFAHQIDVSMKKGGRQWLTCSESARS